MKNDVFFYIVKHFKTERIRNEYKSKTHKTKFYTNNTKRKYYSLANIY